MTPTILTNNPLLLCWVAGLVGYPGTVSAQRVFYILTINSFDLRAHTVHPLKGQPEVSPRAIVFSGKIRLRAGATWYRVKEHLPYTDLSIKDFIVTELTLH